MSSYDTPMLLRPYVHWPLRGLNLVFCILSLALACALVNQHIGNTSSALNFNIFAAIFALVAAVLVLPAPFVSILGHPYLVLLLDGFATLFVFAAATAMAVKIRVHSCGNLNYIRANDVMQGSAKKCHEAQALEVFFWFSFGIFFIATALAVVSIISGGANKVRSSRKAPATA